MAMFFVFWLSGTMKNCNLRLLTKSFHLLPQPQSMFAEMTPVQLAARCFGAYRVIESPLCARD